MTKLLLTTPYQPDEQVTLEKDGIDNYNLSFTRGQGIFSLPDNIPCISLHILAQNISKPTVLLEYPRWENYRKELKKNYDYVGITYTLPHYDRVVEMMKLAKEISPATKIIIGGYGNECFNQKLYPTSEINELADFICKEEGIAFLKRLLNEPDGRPIKQEFPLGGFMPFWKETLSEKYFYLTVALGCKFGCEFCATSAYFKKEKKYFLSPKECYHAIKRNMEIHRGVHNCLIYDEDFLINKKYVDELGRYLRDDPDIQKRRFGYNCFSSVNALSQYTPEELIENGVVGLYLGVESCLPQLFSNDKMHKRKGTPIKDVFDMCNRYGIWTIGTYILGWDFHNKENIMTDIEYYVSLKPSMVQIRPLLALPGTRMWDDTYGQGRITDADKCLGNMNLFSRSLVYRNFTPDEVFHYIDLTAKMINETYGPSSLRMMETALNGYETLRESENPFLRRRAEYLAENARKISPILPVIMEYPYNDHVLGLAQDVLSRYERLFGPVGMIDKFLAMGARTLARSTKRHFERSGNIVPLPKYRRYSYNI